jgi:hypothetical protein
VIDLLLRGALAMKRLPNFFSERVKHMYRQVPPIVVQNREKSQCWAAALVSWLQATTGRPHKTLTELIDQYSDLDDDGISEQQFIDTVINDFNMRFSRTTALLDSGFYNEKLNLGHVLLLYKSGSDSAHTLVIYGVGNSGSTPMISYMDPWYGSYKAYSLAWFANRPKLAAWPI